MCNPLVVGNWKLNGNKSTIDSIIKSLEKKLNSIKNTNIIIAPPTIYLDRFKNSLKTSKIKLCAQNVDIHLSGSFTGETSVLMLKDIGVKYVLLGHSERRIYHKEDDILISRKFFLVKKYGLIPIFCIGENEEEKKQDKTKLICINQINSIIKILGIKGLDNSIIAYEPIWAVNNPNKVINPIEIQSIHKFIREYISRFDVEISRKVILKYGGSVNSNNIKYLLKFPDIDGVLVGRESINVDSFIKIIKIAEKTKNKF